MRGGKPLPIHGDLEPNHSTFFDVSFWSLLESNFRHLFFLKHPLIILVRVKHRDIALVGAPSSVDFPIGVRDELASHAKAKTSIFRVFQRKCSSGECLSLCKRIP